MIIYIIPITMHFSVFQDRIFIYKFHLKMNFESYYYPLFCTYVLRYVGSKQKNVRYVGRSNCENKADSGTRPGNRNGSLKIIKNCLHRERRRRRRGYVLGLRTSWKLSIAQSGTHVCAFQLYTTSIVCFSYPPPDYAIANFHYIRNLRSNRRRGLMVTVTSMALATMSVII
jgi:hypothetical protein